MRPTVKELRLIDLMRDYSAIRKRSFGKTIPPIEKVALIFAPNDEMARIGGGDEASGACCSGIIRCRTVPYVIAINENCGEVEARTTLVHEMAHLKVNIKHGRTMGHGKYWKKEMHRLVGLGELDDWF